MRQRSRRKNYVPNTELLEPRIVLNGAIGVNLNFNESYNNDPIWTDLHNLAESSWAALPPNTSVSLTADDYPLVNASISFNLDNYPDGDYGFSYTGAGTATFSGVGQLAAPATVANGVTTGTIVVNHEAVSTNNLTMTVTNVNPSEPMDNLHIMMPGYGNGTTPEPMFTPAFLQALEPFSDIRFLNWGMTNNSTLSNWSNRVSPTALITDGSGGVPYEDMIELCNEAQKDMWINVPTLATPAFVQDLAQLIDADLDPNLDVYVEYSNETWNYAFTQFGQILTAAEANPLVTQTPNESMMVAQQSAYEEVSIAKSFDQVFGAQSARVRPIMAGQASSPTVASWELQFIQQNYGPPSQFIYASAVAPYIGLASGDNSSVLTMSQLFADINQYMTSGYMSLLQSDVAVAQQYGVQLVAYEGGQSLTGNGLNSNLMLAAQSDPQMYNLYVTMMEDWQAVGGGLFNAYQLTGYGSQFGFWGMLPTVLAPGSQKFDALISMLAPAGDANLDGIVDYGDFQSLEANYGTSNDYWEQGDFNDDGAVNEQDLNILRQNLDPAGFTLSQFAQQAVFGEASTVDTPTALEYDGYGVTSASSLPFAASSGTVKLNQNSQGQSIVLGGAGYAEGVGVLANSSVSLALNGQDARFESTIGVDGTANTGSSVIFDVYGDGQLLYQSPTLTYASGAVPIDVNVAGVNQLTISVVPAPGSNPAIDNAVWADARLVSTANFGSISAASFGSTQPYTLTWQLSQNGTVLSTQTTDSFVFGALSGTYTLTLTVTNAQGDMATASTSVAVIPAVTSASNFKFDTRTQGSWTGVYGSQGFDIIGASAIIPAYATVTPSGQTTETWAAYTTEPRALETDDGAYVVAAAWDSATSFTVDVNLTDGHAHNVTLYVDDFDSQGRSEQIQIISATTGTVLDTRTISSFSAGVYLQWTLSGNVVIKVTDLAGPNAVLNGLFFDPPTSSSTYLSGSDTTTQGNWIGSYGSQGYDVIGNAASLPSYATITTTGLSTYTWTASTTNPSALEDANGTGQGAACWYSTTSFTVDLNLTDGKAHDLTLYFLDWGTAGRSEQVQTINATTGAVLDTETISAFSGGTYLQWVVNGNVLIKVTKLAGPNAVLSGLFLDPVTSSTPFNRLPVPTPAPTASAELAGENTAAQGNWIGTYGTQGYDVIGGATSLPSYATITSTGTSTGTWAASTTDPRALENANGTGGVAAYWSSYTSFIVDVNLSDGQAHDLTLYFVDWDNEGRSEQIVLMSATTGAVLDTETLSSFSEGAHLQWVVTGNVMIEVATTNRATAVLSGVFIDSPTALSAPSPAFEDGTTEGNWIGSYGSQGYDFIGNTASLPSYATITTTGQTSYTWTASTTDPRALQNASGTGRVAACWYSSTSFNIDVNLTDGQAHELSLYAIDWDNEGRGEQIRLFSAVTGAFLDSEVLSSFTLGVYMRWEITGSVVIVVSNVSGASAVISGVFLDSASNLSIGSASASTASLVGSNPATEGNWVGVYGEAGYDVIGNTASLPSSASVRPIGASSFTWTASTTDPRALEDANGTGRVAACWYASTSFTVDLDLGSSQAYDLELYFLDWDNKGREEQVQISAASSGSVLDTETVSSFLSGVYLEWRISGDVVITITNLDGASAELSGLFLDPAPTSVSTPTITWANPAKIVYGTALSGTQLDATASVPGTFTYTPAAGTVLKAGNGQTLSVTFTPFDTIDYTTATATAVIDVLQATPTITWTNPAKIVYGTALNGTQLDAAASVPGTFTYTPAAGTVLKAGNGQTLFVAFTPTDTTDYTSATATAVINVLQATSVITWANPAAIVYGTALSGTQLHATASVPGTFTYTPAAGTVLETGSGQTLSVTFTPTDATDYSTTTASAVIKVLQATPTIIWANPSPITSSTALSGTQLDATSSWTVGGLSGSVAGMFTYTLAAGTVLGDGNNQTLSVSFTPTDTTDFTSATAKVTINVYAANTSATFVKTDTKTQGNWIGVYGTDGYDVINNPSTTNPNSFPAGVTVTPTGATSYTWANPSTATPALEVPGGASRIAACWDASTSFTVDVNLSGGQAHDLELYFVDWDSTSRSEQVQISAAGSGIVLNTETVSSFHSGVYLEWQVSGDVVITITKEAGANAELSGLFLDPTPTSVSTPTITWANPANLVYGTALSGTQLDATASVPGTFTYSPGTGTVLKAGNSQTLWVTFTPTDTTDYTSATATAVINVLQATPTITWANPAAIVYGTALSGTQFDATASVPGNFTYSPSTGTVLKAGNGQTLSATFTPSDTTDYTSATTTVAINVLAVMSTITWANPATITYGTALSGTQLDATASVPGNFAYTPGAGAILKAGNSQTLSVTFTPTDTTDYTSATATAVINVLQATPAITWANPAAIVYGTALSGTQLDATASVPGNFTYSPGTGTVLKAGNSQTLSVTFTPSDTTDYSTTTATATINVGNPTASLVKTDTTTQGNWIGAYGSQGYNLIGNATSYPSYAQVTSSGQSNWTWAANPSSPRALQDTGGAGRMAACWYSFTSFTVDVNLSDGQAHDLELYFVDWDSTSRSEQVQISAAGSGIVLDTETVSSFTSGVYLEWQVSGDVVITITKEAGANAVLSGLFLDPVAVTTASLVGSNATTQGTGSGTTMQGATTPTAIRPSVGGYRERVHQSQKAGPAERSPLEAPKKSIIRQTAKIQTKSELL